MIEEVDESIFWYELLEVQKELENKEKLNWLKKEADELVSVFTSISIKSKK